MIRPIRSQTIVSQSPDNEKHKGINDFIRGSSSVLPRNLSDNETLRKMFQRDDSDDQNDE